MQRVWFTFVLRRLTDLNLTTELYLLAFGPLRSVFSARELDTFTNTMMERGLRVRNGLVETQGLEDNMTGVDGDAEGELEYNASELRRLMPY